MSARTGGSATTSLRIISSPAARHPPERLSAHDRSLAACASAPLTLLGSLDLAPSEARVGEEIRFAGWCFCPDRPLQSVHLLLGHQRLVCSMGRPRADVAAAYPNEPQSAACGFEAAGVFRRPWTGFPIIKALLCDGTSVRFQAPHRLTISAPPLLERIARRARTWRASRASRAWRALRPARIPRVLCVTNDLNITGGPLYLVEAAAALKERCLVDPVVFSPRDGPLRQELEAHGIPVEIREPLPPRLTPESMARHTDSLAREMLQRRIDVVYANTIETFDAIAAAGQAAIPSCWNIHESEPWRDYFQWFAPALTQDRVRQLFALPHRVIFACRQTCAVYDALATRHNFTVLQNAVDPRHIAAAAKHPRSAARRRLGLLPHELAILIVGTVCPRKGQHDLLHAFRQLPPHIQQSTRCFIVGDRPGPYSAALHDLARQLPASLQPRITIIPETPHTAPYYQAADLFVCTSRIESFPRVILEAMAYNLPIIATGVFGIAEQIRPNVNGLFYHPADIPALTAALTDLLRNPARRLRLAQGAPQVLATLNSFDSMTHAYGQLLREALHHPV